MNNTEIIDIINTIFTDRGFPIYNEDTFLMEINFKIDYLEKYRQDLIDGFNNRPLKILLASEDKERILQKSREICPTIKSISAGIYYISSTGNTKILVSQWWSDQEQWIVQVISINKWETEHTWTEFYTIKEINESCIKFIQ